MQHERKQEEGPRNIKNIKNKKPYSGKQDNELTLEGRWRACICRGVDTKERFFSLSLSLSFVTNANGIKQAFSLTSSLYKVPLCFFFFFFFL
jgi:hypothetical protein